jgi:hypothetical protein
MRFGMIAHTNPAATGGRCTGYFWNFGNASARDYFIEHLVAPLALAPMIDGIFYDAVNFAAGESVGGYRVLHLLRISTGRAAAIERTFGQHADRIEHRGARGSSHVLPQHERRPHSAHGGVYARASKELVRPIFGFQPCWFNICLTEVAND